MPTTCSATGRTTCLTSTWPKPKPVEMYEPTVTCRFVALSCVSAISIVVVLASAEFAGSRPCKRRTCELACSIDAPTNCIRLQLS